MYFSRHYQSAGLQPWHLEATKSRSISGKSQRRISIFRGAVSRKNSAFSYATATPRFFRGISVTFSGSEDAELDDHLALDSSEQGGATGIGIGMSEEDGTAIRLDESTSVKEITAGSMTLNFWAWVAAEPSAIKNQFLEYGPFSASGTWTLNYAVA